MLKLIIHFFEYPHGHKEKMKGTVHLKGLNGIRCIAALLVIVSHTFLNCEYYGLPKMAGLQIAGYGVTMFFTLSGFLITYLLLKEKRQFKDVSIKGFYIRRVLRIWPLYYFHLLLAIIVMLVAFPEFLPGLIYYYIFMGANIPFAMAAGGPVLIPIIGHYWSLGVEEQFYLFWPWLVKLFSPLRSVAVFLTSFLLIKLFFRIYAPDSLAYQFIYITKFDCMAIGALTAIIFDKNLHWFSKIAFHPVTQIISWLLYILIATEILSITDFVNHNVFSVACAFIILNVAFNIKPIIGLENRLFDFLGRISYGLYVYHSIVLYLLALLLRDKLSYLPNSLAVIILILVVILITVAISWLSYEYFEKGFLKYKEKFSKVLSKA